MASRGTVDSDYLAEINVTPFVDVLLVLLVIFLVTLPLVIQTIPLNLPRTTLNQDIIPQDPVFVALNTEGEFFLNGEALDFARILEKLTDLRNQEKLGMIILQSDEANLYGEVIEVIGQLKNEGFDKVGLSVEAEQ